MALELIHYAHLGDAVWELFIREITVQKAKKANELHKETIALVNGEFQSLILEKIGEFLTEDEKDLARRGRNLSCARSNKPYHRTSTAFEVLVGYWHINDKNRLNEILDNIKKLL